MNLEQTLTDLGVGDGLGVAVSGGADSTALLHMLAATRRVHVLHVEHGLRDESREDARFVSQLAQDLGLACSVLRVDVDAAAADSPEAAARKARYDALEKEAGRVALRWVATAHTLDDQAETVLMRAIRGSGVGGLGGIPAVRGIFVRPLLSVRRTELRAWLSERGLSWRDDESNADTRFERNWVRHDLMPLIERRRPGAALALARLGSLARTDDETLEALAADVLARSPSDDAGVLLEHLDVLPRSVATRVVRQACWQLGEKPTHTEVDQLMTRDGARCGGLVGRRVGAALALMRDPAPVPAAVSVDADTAGWGVHLRVGSAQDERWTWRMPVPAPKGLHIRSRRPGDRVPTTAGTRKVSDVLVDAKIPRPLRDFVPILADAERPLAVVGLTHGCGASAVVVDARPADPSWTRAAVWNRA